MGVPQFYRWLSEKYAQVVADALEGQGPDGCAPDASLPNPNGIEFDNLYLDMNGLLHPACHPEDGPQPTSEEEMIANVFTYVDKVFSIARPRRLVYMAIDGVAPRAKMNQQRARRFKAAQDAEERAKKEEEIRQKWIEEGRDIPPATPARWDHNVITPGTPFMENVAKGLRYYVAERISTSPAWRNLQVIFSDASVPGEGEHKIMQFLREQRAQPDYNPNMHHVIYGMDADLIMLALATHEVKFTVLRERVTFGKNKGCHICGQKGHIAANCTGSAKNRESEYDEMESESPETPFQFLHIAVLREYLANELFIETPFGWDLERVIDDFVFLCFFVGNDFLPHLPSLEIREGALDDLIDVYKNTLASLGGYVTDAGFVDLSRADVILSQVASVEAEVFRRRKQKEDAQKIRQAQQRNDQQQTRTIQKRNRDNVNEVAGVIRPIAASSRASNEYVATANVAAAKKLRTHLRFGVNDGDNIASTPSNANSNAAALLKARLKHVQPSSETKTSSTTHEIDVEPDFDVALKQALRDMTVAPESEDKVCLHARGYKERYYAEKFKIHVNSSGSNERRRIVQAYAEGLCWVMRYYYHGVASWGWYYPYHYAPLASDLVNLDNCTIAFKLGKPFSPLSQLMGVLPPASRHCLPHSYGQLMIDASSPVLDLYPTQFALDMNGKYWAWQAVILLPFIDESRLLKALASVHHTLNAEELARDSSGKDCIYAHFKSALGRVLVSLPGMEVVKLNPNDSLGVFGDILVASECKLEIKKSLLLNLGPYSKEMERNYAISAEFRAPPSRPHVCRLIVGAQVPTPLLNDVDFQETTSIRRYGGRRLVRRQDDYSNGNQQQYDERRRMDSSRSSYRPAQDYYARYDHNGSNAHNRPYNTSYNNPSYDRPYPQHQYSAHKPNYRNPKPIDGRNPVSNCERQASHAQQIYSQPQQNDYSSYGGYYYDRNTQKYVRSADDQTRDYRHDNSRRHY